MRLDTYLFVHDIISWNAIDLLSRAADYGSPKYISSESPATPTAHVHIIIGSNCPA